MNGFHRDVGRCRRSQRATAVQSGAELARQGRCRLRLRRKVRHPVAERRRHAGHLAMNGSTASREQRSSPIPGRAGTSRAPATSTSKARPTSCGRTTTARGNLADDGFNESTRPRSAPIRDRAGTSRAAAISKRRQVRHPVAARRRQPAIWLMDGLRRRSTGAAVGPNPGAELAHQGHGDFNNDGRSDILWQHDGGEAAIWTMNGLSVLTAGVAGSFDPRGGLTARSCA